MGERGPAGPEGQPGLDYAAPVYVGTDACKECHEELHATYMQSGHPMIMSKVVDGKAPSFPNSEVPDPPEGYTWEDISYVIGGFGWKALFTDQDGYIITGKPVAAAEEAVAASPEPEAAGDEADAEAPAADAGETVTATVATASTEDEADAEAPAADAGEAVTATVATASAEDAADAEAPAADAGETVTATVATASTEDEADAEAPAADAGETVTATVATASTEDEADAEAPAADAGEAVTATVATASAEDAADAEAPAADAGETVTATVATASTEDEADAEAPAADAGEAATATVAAASADDEADAGEADAEEAAADASDETTGDIAASEAAALTQFNLANKTLKTDDEWVSYHAGEQLVMDCGSCHTTGYVPKGNQEGRPGFIGTWVEAGVGCEACHGPGSNHVNAPYQVSMVIERDAELCGACHGRGDPREIESRDGFIDHQQQYDELFASKKRVMQCVDCHNPHETVKYADGFGALTTCDSCHYNEKEYQKITDRKHAQCTDCHMPMIDVSAVSNAERHLADMRTHLFAINPNAKAQFDKDGFSLPYLTVDSACRGCHSDAGRAPNLSTEELAEVAVGYHDRDLAGSKNEK